MKMFVSFLFYSLFLLFLGRNLPFLPQVEWKAKEQNTQDIKRKVQQFIMTQKGMYSLYYKDVTSGKEFGINENRVLAGASLNKLMIVSYLYHLAAKNKIDLEEKVVIQKEDIQDYGTGMLRYNGVGETLSLRSLAQLALEKSDNTAGYVLGIKLNMEDIEAYAKELGLSSSSMKNNKTSAKDMGKILDLLYNEKITNKAYTQEFLDFLKDTDFEDRLPRFLEEDVVVYHKIGDAVNMVHDVGILDAGKKPFILAVLTTEIVDEEEAKRALGELAKIIYEERSK